MKFHVFYLKEKDRQAYLYAYTDEKRLAQRFMDERDPEKFIYKEIKLNKEEGKRFQVRYSAACLGMRGFYTKNPLDSSKKTTRRVCCTAHEEETVVLGEDKIWEGLEDIWFDPTIFKEKYFKALETLLFMKYFLFYKVKTVENADSYLKPYMEGKMIMYEDDPYSRDFFHLDELMVFVDMYGYTFRPSGKKKKKAKTEW